MRNEMGYETVYYPEQMDVSMGWKFPVVNNHTSQ